MEKKIQEVNFVEETNSAWTAFMAKGLPVDDPYFKNQDLWSKAFNELTQKIFEYAFKDGYNDCLQKHHRTIENAPRLEEMAHARMKRLREVHDHPDTPESVRKLINLPGFMRGGLG